MLIPITRAIIISCMSIAIAYFNIQRLFIFIVNEVKYANLYIEALTYVKRNLYCLCI